VNIFRDALLQQLDLVKEVYDKSGINNPLFIKESLGGDKSIQKAALKNLIDQKRIESDINTINQDREIAKEKGTFVEPTDLASDELTIKQNQLNQLKQEFNDITTGKYYATKLKSSLVSAYYINNPNKLTSIAWQSGFHIGTDYVDKNNTDLKIYKETVKKNIEDFNLARQSALEGHLPLVSRLESYKKADNDFMSDLDSFLSSIGQYSVSPENLSRVVNDVKSKRENLEKIEEESIGQDVTPDIQKDLERLSFLRAREERLSGITPDSKPVIYDDNKAIKEFYISSLQNQIKDLENNKANLGDEAYTRPGGILDDIQDRINVTSQILDINKNVYNTIDNKYSGLSDNDKLTNDQYTEVNSSIKDLNEKISDLKSSAEVSLNDRKNIQNKRRYNKLRIDGYLLESSIKIAGIAGRDNVKSSWSKMANAIEALESNKDPKTGAIQYNDNDLLSAEKYVRDIEDILHDHFISNPSDEDKIKKYFIELERPGEGFDLKTAAIMLPYEFLQDSFDTVFSLEKPVIDLP